MSERRSRQYYNTAGGATGPLVQRLELIGELNFLIVGAFGDATVELHYKYIDISNAKCQSFYTLYSIDCGKFNRFSNRLTV